jgi:hypothetical protein
MSDQLFHDQRELEQVAARQLKEALTLFWAIWDLPSAPVAVRFATLNERAVELTRSALLALEACEDDADDTIQALATLTLINDDLLLAAFSDSDLSTLVAPSRAVLDGLLRRSGVANWALRLGAPLHDAAGVVITFGLGPLPGVRPDIGVETALAYGAPGAELAASDARRDIASAIALAAPLCRDLLEGLAANSQLTPEFRYRFARTGISLIRTSRVAGPAILIDLALHDSASFNIHSEGHVLMRWIGEWLVVAANARSLDDRALRFIGAEEISELEDFASSVAG